MFAYVYLLIHSKYEKSFFTFDPIHINEWHYDKTNIEMNMNKVTIKILQALLYVIQLQISYSACAKVGWQ